MLDAVAGAIEPPYRAAIRGAGGNRVQHRKHRRYADACADQHDRKRSGCEREFAAWRADLERVAHAHAIEHVAIGALHRDPVRAAVRRSRYRIASQDVLWLQPQDDELTR